MWSLMFVCLWQTCDMFMTYSAPHSTGSSTSSDPDLDKWKKMGGWLDIMYLMFAFLILPQGFSPFLLVLQKQESVIKMHLFGFHTQWYMPFSHWFSRGKSEYKYFENTAAECDCFWFCHRSKAWSCSSWWLCSGLALPSTTPNLRMEGLPSSTCLNGVGLTLLKSVNASWVPKALAEFRSV